MSGCASIKELRGTPAGWENLPAKGNAKFADTPSILKVKLIPSSFVVKSKALCLPDEVDTNISVEFPGVELEKALYAISVYTGINVFLAKTNRLYATKSAVSDTATATGGSATQVTNSTVKSEYINRQTMNNPLAAMGLTPGSADVSKQDSRKLTLKYRGKLSKLLKIISENTGVFFTYEDGTIFITENENFSVVVPAYPKLLDEIEGVVMTLGGKSISYDKLSSRLNFNADYQSYKQIVDYCDKLRGNASLITMRILLLNIRLNDGTSSGIDWTKMIAGGGAQKPLSLGYSAQAQSQAISGASSTSTTSTTTGTTGTTTGSANDALTTLGAIGAATVFNSTGANLFVEGANFSISAMFSFMENYGRMSVLQNVFVESLSGTKGRIDVLTETPYVSEVSFSSLSTQATLPSQAVKTATAKDGVEMEILPFYNKQDGSLTIGLKMALLGVTRMVDLEAGQQIGRITQPETTRKNVETYLRMSPQQIAIIGGLIIEKSNDNMSGLPGDTYLSKNVVKSNSKEELVVLVKPTIIEFE
jgi:hypothetical protein